VLNQTFRKWMMKIAILLLPIFLSNTVAAACFSEKDTWYTETIKPTVAGWDVYKSLKLGAGSMRSFECVACEDIKTWAVSSVSRTDLVFRFKTKAGDFIFHADPSIELKGTDIDFNEDKETGGHNRIYRELVLKGHVTIPASAKKGFAAKPPKAVLILRGMGSNCYEPSSFQKWLLRVDTDERQLTGSGQMIDTTAYSKSL
jgi:hypothetical protein